MKAGKGEWVMIHNIVLAPSERAPQVPDDTKEVPLEMWVRASSPTMLPFRTKRR